MNTHDVNLKTVAIPSKKAHYLRSYHTCGRDLDGVAHRMIGFPLLFKGMSKTLLEDEKLISESYI